MINLRILFGWVPKTADYEASQEALRKEYNDLNAFSQSKELADYIELEKTVKSPDFARRKKNILSRKFSDTEEYKKEREYLGLKKRREIKRYYRIKDSVELKDFLEFDKSYDVKHYHTLEKLIGSDEFIQQRKNLGKRKFKLTPEYEKYQEFIALKKSKRFRDYFAFKKLGDYVNFTLLIGSEKIFSFEQLGLFVNSEAFKKVKEYMMLPGRKKLEMSEEFRMGQKYLELKKSDRFVWYFKTRNSKKFNEIKRWHLNFSDEFDTPGLDKHKWLTRYYWGETVLKDSYVNEGEKQFYTGEKNLDVANSVLKIRTKHERVSGKVWSPAIGFFPRDFDYTSGIINSGGKFRQQYGLFEAKIRFNLNHPVNHAFWMVSDLILPHIDIARATKNIRLGNLWGNPNVRGGVAKKDASMSRSRYGSDYYIFSLEWTRDKLFWKLNGVTAYTTREGVPHVPMYVNIGSALYQDVNGSVLPAEVEVDWIRCYQSV
ncbi:MAG TPA: glycoside hydrolase family 16 protein [Bacteroidales bacterium]|nr:glycoside hydrolase family 16 protein [Bacteroidales bacterium]